MARKQTVSHFAEDVLTDKLHIGADIPKFMSDLEVFLLSFLAGEIKFYPFVIVIVNDIFVIDQGCLGLLVAPPSQIYWLKWFDLLVIFVKFIDRIPTGVEERLNWKRWKHLLQIKLLFWFCIKNFLTHIAKELHRCADLGKKKFEFLINGLWSIWSVCHNVKIGIDRNVFSYLSQKNR